jgi:hypothetical protein
MFAFYNIDDLLLTYHMRSLKVASENGYEVVMSDLRLSNYSIPIQKKVEQIRNQGLVKIVDQQESWMDFIEEHHSTYSHLGKSLLCLYHFCQSSNIILVVDEDKGIVCQGAKAFGVTTTTLEEFYKDTIREEKYLNFIMELKQQEITK